MMRKLNSIVSTQALCNLKMSHLISESAPHPHDFGGGMLAFRSGPVGWGEVGLLAFEEMGLEDHGFTF